jgi:single-stranded-DNA-specific exonuclease
MLPQKLVTPTYEPEAARNLAKQLGIHPTTSQILIHRGIKTLDEARAFLRPSLDDLHNPFLLPDMESSVQRIEKAIKQKEKILICGDYDVDGITGTALLLKFLKFLGAHVDFYIPNRLTEGYGLHLNAIQKAQQEGVKLLLSVDNGTTAFDEVAMIRNLNMDIIITDHHCPSENRLPEAFSIINPKLPQSKYPFHDLSGAGVALKLAWALGEKYCSLGQKKSSEFKDLLKEMIALSTLGTISDVVPLMGENRILAKFGLEALAEAKSPGLHALLEIAGIRDKTLKTKDISFKIAPLLNAAGRLGDADICLRLFQTNCSVEAYKLSKSLSKQNIKRRDMCREIYQDALRKIQSEKIGEDPVWVLHSPDWHPGLIGVVASRLVSEFYRPVVLISIEGEKGKGSCRSVYEFPIYPLLQEANALLVKFGGHMLAAGFEIEKKNISLFQKKLNELSQSTASSFSTPQIHIDGEVSFDQLNLSLVKELEDFAPFGHNNKKPLFFTNSIQIVGKPKKIGSRNSHLLIYMKQENRVLKGVALGKGNLFDFLTQPEQLYSICYHPFINAVNGSEVELDVQEILTNFVV